MQLTEEEQAIYDGECGEVPQKAMEILSALGTIYGADGLIPIQSVQVAGVSYKNLGDAGKDFVAWWVDHGACATAPSMLNPAGTDLSRWEELGFPQDFAANQQAIVDLYAAIGIMPSCTCTPYEAGNIPKMGDHLAWSESSAVSFANSYIGARTNREGGPSALASAIIGKTPNYGYHLDAERRPTLRIDVEAPVETEADCGALGIVAGKLVRRGVPYFSGMPPLVTPQFKQLGAAMAAAGSVALYHVDGQTPEARCGAVGPDGTESCVVSTLDEGYALLNTGGEKIDFVSLGCPHASVDEVRQIASLLRGKTVSVPCWITTSVAVQCQAQRYGYQRIIEGAGAKLVTDTCMVVSPIESFGFETVATNSAKGCYYMQSWCKVDTRFGTVRDCIDAAISGRWSP
jgi:predicted aconitase